MVRRGRCYYQNNGITRVMVSADPDQHGRRRLPRRGKIECCLAGEELDTSYIWDSGPDSVPWKMPHKHPRHGLCNFKG